MDSVFIFKLILSFFVGGLWIILVTVLSDKFGSKIGGVIAGIPSTLLISLIFLAWTQTPAVAVAATRVVPLGGINSGLFLLVFAATINFGLLVSLACAFAFWGIFAGMIITYQDISFSLAFIAYFLATGLIYWLMHRWLKIRSLVGKKIHYTPALLILRGFLSGFIVALAVFLTKLGGPVFGGIFSMFPALFSSTMVITYLAQGPNFSRAIAKTISLSHFISVMFYVLGVRYTYLSLGLIPGTILSLMLAIFISYFLYQLVIKKLA